MRRTAIVLGAGMIGTCTALHLRQRGFDVVLVDRRGPGEETSYGNAGIIQREAVEPYAFPRAPGLLLRAALGRGADVHYHWRALPQVAPELLRYFRASAPAPFARSAAAFAKLIEHCLDEHAPLIEAAGAQSLVRREGFRFVFRTEAAFREAVAEASRLSRSHGVGSQVLDGDALAAVEPSLRTRLAGAIHWTQPWTVADPGALVAGYARLLQQRGGSVVEGDAATLTPAGAGWRVRTAAGWAEAAHAVIALGPWSDTLVRTLGYRLPLFAKRGYHRHYATPQAPALPLLDAERGYVLAPMTRGLRLSTGAEFAAVEAPPTPVQLARCEPFAAELFALGTPVEQQPWLGRRPCTVDMLPVMGPAPRHAGLWFNFGHAHQGFTLGPVAGRLLATMIAGEPMWVDPAPYSAQRFL